MEPRGTNMSGTPAPHGAVFEEPQILTRKSLKELKRKREQEGFLFPLEMTGGYARVRFPSMADRTFLDQLPSDLQHLVSEQLASESPAGRRKKAETVAEMTGDEQLAYYKNLLSSQDEFAKRTMVLCWISPKVVLTEDELDPLDDNQILADDIHVDDRLAYMGLCLSGEKEAAQRLADFHKQSVGTLPAESHVQAAAAPEPAAGAA